MQRPIFALARNIALIAFATVAACRERSPTAPTPPQTPSLTVDGVLAGPAGESGTLLLTTAAGAAAGVSAYQAVGAAGASGGGIVNLTGTVVIIGSGTHDLTGTYDPGTGAIGAAGGGYSFTGSLVNSKASGTYTGPNGSGTFAAVPSNATTASVQLFCGTYSGTDRYGGGLRPKAGVLDLVQSGDTLIGISHETQGGGSGGILIGHVVGSSISLSIYDPSGKLIGTATGTLSGASASGTYVSTDSLATGTWSGSTASCSTQPATAEFTIAQNFDGQSAAFDGTNYLVGMQSQLARNTNQPGVFAQFVSSSGGPVGNVLGPLGPSGNIQGDPPCVSFGASNYLVAWAGNFSQTGGDILGQLVPTAGSSAGAGFAMTSTHDASSTGGIAFGGGNYFVAYDRTSGTLHQIYGRFVSVDGTVAAEFPISSGFGQVHDFVCHQVAFDGTNFLVVWIEESSDPSQNDMAVKGRFVSPSGSLGTEFTVTAGAPTKGSATVAYNGSVYLVVWNAVIDAATYDYDVLGQVVTPAGVLAGGVVPIAAGPGFQYGEVSAGGADFLVVWDDFQSSVASAAIKGKIFDGSGALIGAERTLFTQAPDGRVPSTGTEVFNGRDYLAGLGRATAPSNPFDFQAYTNWSLEGAFISPWGGATPPPVASVTVVPAAVNLTPGGTVQLTAITKDAAGNVLTGRAVTWASSNPAVATISASGLVTGVAVGSATITATSEGQSGSAQITMFSEIYAGPSSGSITQTLIRAGCDSQFSKGTWVDEPISLLVSSPLSTPGAFTGRIVNGGGTATWVYQSYRCIVGTTPPDTVGYPADTTTQSFAGYDFPISGTSDGSNVVFHYTVSDMRSFHGPLSVGGGVTSLPLVSDTTYTVGVTPPFTYHLLHVVENVSLSLQPPASAPARLSRSPVHRGWWP